MRRQATLVKKEALIGGGMMQVQPSFYFVPNKKPLNSP